MLEHEMLIVSGRVLNNVIYTTIWMPTVNVYSIVIYDVITVDYSECILLYSSLNSYLIVYNYIYCP